MPPLFYKYLKTKMRTFQEFLEIIEEGKKVEKLAKEISKTVKKDVKRQERENPEKPAVRNYDLHQSEPGSKERRSEVMAMMADMKKLRKQHWG